MQRKSAVWKGSVSFGLVQFNIELYNAIKPHYFGFNLLHAKCNTPINYKRICPTCNQEVEWQDLVKGLKLEDGTYFIITKEKLEKLKPQKTDFIQIIEFVDKNLIEAIYYDQHYYILPSKSTDKAFFLFNLALEKAHKVAIGQFVLRDKQYVCTIEPYKNILLLNTLNYQYEIKNLNVEALKMPKFTLDEINLANQLINKLTVKKFDIGRFKDTFAEELKKQISMASKTKKNTKAKKEKEAQTHISLAQALKKSIKSKIIPKTVYSEKPVARAKSK